MRLLVCAATLVAWSGCGQPPPTPPEDAGEQVGIASTEQIVAWEGQLRFVTVLSTATGDSLEGATVAAEDPSGPLQVVEQRCAASRCAVVVRVRDLVPNTGTPIPPPIDGRDAYLRVLHPSGPDLRTLIRVMPLDTIDGGGTTTLRTGGVRLASSADMPGGASFGGQEGGEPLRWVIFGDARFGGRIDVSGEGAVAFAGGGAGGEPGASAEGPSGGRAAGEAGEGGGGGGGAEPGQAGDGAGGEPGEGGAAGAAGSESCALDFFASACGGGGGGGATGPGGAGGGALVIVSLGELDLSAATLRSAGGAGAMGGGGGGGGFVALAAPEWRAPAAVDVAGGAGEGAGGDGGAGGVHVQVPGDPGLDAELGPAVDLAGVPAITSEATLELEGRAAPGAQVVVEEEGGARFEATADATGAFTVSVTLEPGLNRLAVTQELEGERTRSWVGTSIDLESPSPGVALPVGARIDVAYLP